MSRSEVIHAVHASPTMAVLAVTGGGVLLVSDLLLVPGASRTVLEAVVPYSSTSLAEWLVPRGADAAPEGAAPAGDAALSEVGAMSVGGGAVSVGTAARLARAARHRAAALAEDPEGGGDPAPLVGLGITAALASDRPKKGDHRAHLALCGPHAAEPLVVWTVTLAKGARSRPAEDRVVADLGLLLLAEGCGLAVELDCGLRSDDVWERSR